MTLKKILAVALLAVLLVGCIVVPGTAEINKSTNPLVDAQDPVKTHTDDDLTNILLLGIEQGTEGQGAPSADSTKRRTGKEILSYHTDAVMVLSVNRTQGKINLISIPRDTLVYVPGVYGVYKMNAAFNCASTVKEGFRHSRDTVSWLLGGVKIDAYVGVDMGAVVALGDAMGGIDLDIEVGYTGHSGRSYRAGTQHLDGQGIMDYVRARKNIEGSDQKRTERGRKMISAIIQKLWSNWDLVNTLWQTANSGKINFFTDIEAGDLLALYNAVQELDNTEIGSYMLAGTYGQTGLPEYYFNILDQDARIELLKDAFGIDAEPLPYTSMAYTNWLSKGHNDTKASYTDDGLDYVRHLHIGQKVLDHAYATSKPSADQQAALEDFEAIYNDFLAAFEEAADKANSGIQSATISGVLKKNYENSLKNLAQKFGYSGSLSAGHTYFWWQDYMSINQYNESNGLDWR